MLALAGTADDTTKNTICSEQTLKEDVLKIFISPHRVNIRISVNYVKKEVMGNQIEWLVEEVKEKGEATPKTIIFCNTLKDIATVVNLLFFKLGKHATVPVGSSDNNDFIIGIFHSVSWPKMCKVRGISLNSEGAKQLNYKMKKETSWRFSRSVKKRIIVASTALSMGVNFGDVRNVINWGPARNILDQIQEAGRAGRDEIKSHLIVIYHGNQLSYCEDEVKVFVKSEGCYQVALYKTFDQEMQPVNPGHDCCNESCIEVVPFETPYVVPVSSPALTRPVCEKDKADIRAAFTELVEENNDNALGATSKHAFSKELVNDIVKNCHQLFTHELSKITEDNFTWDSFPLLPVHPARSPIDLAGQAAKSQDQTSKESKVRVSLPPEALDKSETNKTGSSSDELASLRLQKETESLQIERLQLELQLAQLKLQDSQAQREKSEKQPTEKSLGLTH
ncbi:hypothetical protein ACROYT_G015515 [Oculina patagonica]